MTISRHLSAPFVPPTLSEQMKHDAHYRFYGSDDMSLPIHDTTLIDYAGKVELMEKELALCRAREQALLSAVEAWSIEAGNRGGTVMRECAGYVKGILTNGPTDCEPESNPK